MCRIHETSETSKLHEIFIGRNPWQDFEQIRKIQEIQNLMQQQQIQLQFIQEIKPLLVEPISQNAFL